VRLRRLFVRALLRLYPREFRSAHALELEELHSEMRLGILRLTWDLAVNAVRVRLDEMRDAKSLLPRRRRRPAVLDGLASDFAASVRAFRRRPAFTALVVATLALGIGANVAIFTVLHWVVLRPLPYPGADELVRVWWRRDSFNQRIIALYRERARAFEDLAAFSGWSFTLRGEGEPEELSGAVVSTNFFSVLGVSPILGRGFMDEEGEPGRSDVCIVSRGLWTRRFGGDERILGRRIELTGAGRDGCTVVGVVTDAETIIDGSGPRQAFLPLERAADLEKDNSWFLSAVARLSRGASLESANVEAAALAQFVRREMYPRTSEDEVKAARVETLRDAMVGGEWRAELLLLSTAAGMVLLVACSNLATLLLAQSSERERELAVRSALGAGRGRVLRQLLSESLALGLAGGLAGTVLAALAVSFSASKLPADLPRTEGLAQSAWDGSVLLFAFAASVVATLLFAVLPALRASKRGVVARSLRAGATAGGRERHRLDRWIATAEVASSLVLLTAAGLVLDGFLRLVRVDPGFDAERVLVAGVQAPETSYSDARKRQLFAGLRERIASIAGVEHVGSIHLLPFDPGNWDFPFYPQGLVLGLSDTPPRANFRIVTPGYFRAMGIPLLEGRDLSEADRSDGAPIGLVNQRLAREIWPNESAVGKEVRIFGPTGPVFTVVGVVGEIRQHGLAIEPAPEMYRPLEQWTLGRNYVMVRTSRDPESLVSEVRDAIGSVDSGVPIVRLSPMTEVIAGSVAATRITAALVTAFALLALGLAAVGIYGVAASAAAARVREIGIRMAFGASAASVLGRALRQGMAPVASGVALGLVGILAASETLTSILPATAPPRPAILAPVVLFLALVAFAACYFPARRASRTDPVTALRQE
jgi:predicted permease